MQTSASIHMRWLAASLLLLAVVSSACGSSSSGSGQVQGSAVPASGQTPKPAPTRAVLAVGSELATISDRFNTNTYQDNYVFMVNSPLVVLDPQGQPHPLLATEQPSQDKGTWVVNPDGTMTTTWKIRPGAKWHDGEPVTSLDFAFALRVYLDPGIPVVDRTPESYMSRIDPVDADTFVIYWNRTYPFANQLIIKQMQAQPEHILGSVFAAGDPDAFMNNPYWTTPEAFVGNGPYKMVSWERGIELTFRAFDDYFMGRPKIDEIVFKVIPDDNTVVANVLGGSVDATLGISVGLNGGMTIRNQWAGSNGGDVLATPIRWEYIQIQLDPARTGSPALLDPRVRRGLSHALDLVTTADTLTQGLLSTPALVPIIPTDPLFATVDQAITKYPYNTATALQILQDAGWTRRGGDALVDASGQQLSFEIRGNAGGGGTEPEMHIDAADWSKIGVHVDESIIPNSRLGDLEYRVTFPGMTATAQSIDVPGTMGVLVSDQCPVAPRYVGSNRGCWKSPDYDEQFTLANSSLDPMVRRDAIVQGLRVLTQQVGAMGEYYSLETIAVRRGLIGPGARWPGQTGNTWNVHEWYWQR